MGVTFTPTQEQEALRVPFSQGKHMVIQAGAGTGKALRDDQRVLTPSGFKSIGSLLTGDEVIGSEGTPVKVIGVYPQGVRPLFDVRTSDGVSIIADADHLWLTQTTRDRQKGRGWAVRTTEEIANSLTVSHGELQRTNHYLPMLSSPVQGTESPLPLDPWLIGALLGDGSLSEGSIGFCNSQKGIIIAVRRALPEGVRIAPANSLREDGLNWRITTGNHVHRNPVISALRDLGMMGHKSVDKRIPEVIFAASAGQRLALLQGLMDTDAHVQGSVVEYCTSSYDLALGVRELVRSLGGIVPSMRSRIPKYTYQGEKRNGARSWRLTIVLPPGMSPFLHSNNAEKRVPRSKYPPRRQIVSVTPVDSDYATCIKVDAEDSLFVTEGYVLTHNTSSLKLLASDMYDSDPGAMAYYIAFNRAMADEVEHDFVYGNVLVSTIHAMARRALVRDPFYMKLLSRLNRTNTLPPWEVHRHFKVNDTFIYDAVPHNQITPAKLREYGLDNEDDEVVPGTAPDAPMKMALNPEQLCQLAVKTIDKWCRSDRDELSVKDVPRREGMKLEDHFKRLAPLVLRIAKKMWEDDILKLDGQLRFTHDYYPKIWALTKPSIVDTFMPGASRGVLFFDEAQDATPLVARLVREQMNRMQVVAVGDSRQAIYNFLGVTDYLTEMSNMSGTVTLPLSQSWRFGNHVANLANDILSMLPGEFQISGNPGLSSVVMTFDAHTKRPEVDAIICRSNGQLLNELLTELQSGRKVFCQTNTEEIKRICKDISQLRLGKKAFHPDMKFFSSIRELEDYLSDPEMDTKATFATLAKVILEVGEGHVSRALSMTVETLEEADVVISTIHKAKGSEWERVRIVGDNNMLFPVTKDTRLPVKRGNPKDALMLLYVAITRAKYALYIDSELYESIQGVAEKAWLESLTEEERERALSSQG